MSTCHGCGVIPDSNGDGCRCDEMGAQEPQERCCVSGCIIEMPVQCAGKCGGRGCFDCMKSCGRDTGDMMCPTCFLKYVLTSAAALLEVDAGDCDRLRMSEAADRRREAAEWCRNAAGYSLKKLAVAS